MERKQKKSKDLKKLKNLHAQAQDSMQKIASGLTSNASISNTAPRSVMVDHSQSKHQHLISMGGAISQRTQSNHTAEMTHNSVRE